jgi:plastocyanin
VGLCAPSAAARLEKENVMPRILARSCAVALPALAGLYGAAPALACDPGTSLPLAGVISAAGHGAGIGAGIGEICPPLCIDDAAVSGAVALGASSGGGSGLTGFGPIVDIDVRDFAFDSDAVTIKPNTSVRWNHVGIFPHTTTGPIWDSGQLSGGADFTFLFGATNAGTSYDYICSNHFGMEGNVTVVRFGDANLDLQVNSDDFNILATNFGLGGQVWETGDFSGDGFVNSDDFNLLATNFGQPVLSGDAINIDLGNFIPEPSATVMLLAFGGLIPRFARRH